MAKMTAHQMRMAHGKSRREDRERQRIDKALDQLDEAATEICHVLSTTTTGLTAVDKDRIMYVIRSITDVSYL